MPGPTRLVMYPTNGLVDMRVGPNLVNDTYLGFQCRRKVQQIPTWKLIATIHQSISVVIFISLIV